MLLQNIQNELVDLILHEELTGEFVSQSLTLNIYRNNIRSNLENTLKTIYPLVERIVGTDFFNLLLKEYIEHYPSRSGNLHDFGEYFSDFLAEYEPLKSLNYLPEVATFEWMHHVLYFAYDHPGFDPRLLEKISENQYESLHFMLNPACFLKKFRYPIVRILALCEDEIDTVVNLDEGGVELLMIRRDFNIVLCELPPADFIFLNKLADNYSLRESVEAALIIEQDFDLTEKLLNWINDKTIVECFFE